MGSQFLDVSPFTSVLLHSAVFWSKYYVEPDRFYFAVGGETTFWNFANQKLPEIVSDFIISCSSIKDEINTVFDYLAIVLNRALILPWH